MSAIHHSFTTKFTDIKYETVFGVYLHSVIKSHILNILRDNKYLAEYNDFVYKVVRSRWTEDGEDVEFGGKDQQEAEQAHVEMQRERILRECTVEFVGENIPRLVAVQYAQDYSKIPVSGNMYPPVGNFRQKGMVIDLGSREILNPGMSWINTVENIQVLDDISIDTFWTPTVQVPIEGATVSMFIDPVDDQIYLATGHRVLSLRKIYLHNRGSRWNFFGTDLRSYAGGIFYVGNTARGFNIHGAALECIANACLDHKGIDQLSANDEEVLDTVESLIKETIFSGSKNLVLVGLVSGKSFAGQSRTLTEEDLEFTTFTPTSYLLREFHPESRRTHWAQELETEDSSWDRLDAILRPYSLDIDKFTVDHLPSTYYATPSENTFIWLTGNNTEKIGMMNDKEDLLLIQEVRENGSRGIYRYCASQTKFRENVLRGVGEELEEIKTFFPKHRARTTPTPANIRERVQQVITLSIAGNSLYTFHQIDLLGSDGAKKLGGRIFEETQKLCGKDRFNHWKDVAFPISDFSIQTTELGSKTVPRMLVSQINRSLCNSLTVLYACASESLREQIVLSIAEFFANRAAVAAAAFLPHRAYTDIERKYLEAVPKKDADTRLPAGIHKLRILRSLSATTSTHSSRKYKIAGLISKNTALDITFMASVVNA